MRSFLAAVSLLVVSPASAEEVHCDMWSDLAAESPAPSLWTVKAGSGQLMFQTNSGEGYSCPGDDPKCSANAYLIDGDSVVVTSEAGDYACATFTNDGKENISTSGWLPKVSLEPVTLPAAGPRDFVGKWRYFDEQSIDITAAKDGTLTISGDASWGMPGPSVRLSHCAASDNAINIAVLRCVGRSTRPARRKVRARGG